MKNAKTIIDQVKEKEAARIERIRVSYMKSLKNMESSRVNCAKMVEEFLDEYPHLKNNAKFIKDMESTYYYNECNGYSWDKMLDEWRDEK